MTAPAITSTPGPCNTDWCWQVGSAHVHAGGYRNHVCWAEDWSAVQGPAFSFESYPGTFGHVDAFRLV